MVHAEELKEGRRSEIYLHPHHHWDKYQWRILIYYFSVDQTYEGLGKWFLNNYLFSIF